MAKPKRITARATVNLPGLPAGQSAQVDPNDNRVAGLLRTGLLVNEEAPYEEPTATEERPAAAATGRDAEKASALREEAGDAAPASTTTRPRASSTASQSPTD